MAIEELCRVPAGVTGDHPSRHCIWRTNEFTCAHYGRRAEIVRRDSR
jgi:hypothetical protein